MAVLKWDQTSERLYETGVDRGVLFLPDATGAYNTGVAWNGLVSVTESPSGAEANKQYADNRVYLNLFSAEEFSGTIEAFTFPDEFMLCDGTASPKVGVYVGQQNRRSFGFAYRTKIGNDVAGNDHGYKLHLVYGAMASPSEKAYTTVNDSPEPITFSWGFTTTPVDVDGLEPTALIMIDSTKVAKADLEALEALLYGSADSEPELPLPDDVFALFTDPVAPDAPNGP